MQTKDNAQFFIVNVKAWVQKGDQFLIARRADTELHEPGQWSLPGGKVERNLMQNNILETTLKEEIKEEVDLEIEPRIALIRNSQFERSDGSVVVGMTFLVQHKAGEAIAQDETAEVKWLAAAELEALAQTDDIQPFMKREIKALLENIEII